MRIGSHYPTPLFDTAPAEAKKETTSSLPTNASSSAALPAPSSQTRGARPRPNALTAATLARAIKNHEGGKGELSAAEPMEEPQVHLRGGGNESSSVTLRGKALEQSWSYFRPVPPKEQARMTDCWYAAMTMVFRGKYGEGYKLTGDALKKARGPLFLGKMLSFGSRTGQKIMDDNGFVAIGDKLELGSTQSVANLLQQYGPFLVAGKFHSLNFGHCIVVMGVDHESQSVCIQDPADSPERPKRRPIGYLAPVYRVKGSDNLEMNSVLAMNPDV